jgi:ABC-2 type transport system ATP-binding protein
MDIVIETRSLSKTYREKMVVNSVNLTVRRGEVYGFLGPNGAGKTTGMKMILGLLPPSTGSVALFGRTVGGNRTAALRRIGMASEMPYLYSEMTAREYLGFFAGLYEVENPTRRIKEILGRFGLSEVLGKRLRTFSQGMTQRVNLARAFLHDPEVLLLDEPVVGLDPHWIKELRNIIEEARSRQRTVFLSSHLLSIVETVCDRVGIINKGRLIAEGSLEAITGALTRVQMITVEVAEMKEAISEALRRLDTVTEVTCRGNFLSLRCEGGTDMRERIAKAVTEAGGTALMVRIEKGSLEDTFLELTEGNVSLLGKS